MAAQFLVGSIVTVINIMIHALVTVGAREPVTHRSLVWFAILTVASVLHLEAAQEAPAAQLPPPRDHAEEVIEQIVRHLRHADRQRRGEPVDGVGGGQLADAREKLLVGERGRILTLPTVDGRLIGRQGIVTPVRDADRQQQQSNSCAAELRMLEFEL